MENTYTYTARSVDDSEKVVTFTLRGRYMSVGLGAPLEQIERVLQPEAEEEVEAEEGEEPLAESARPRLWLRPLALSLMERATRPFLVKDVDAWTEDDWLHVRAWFRAGGLRLLPINLMAGRVDNPDAAYAFVEELERRKPSAGGLIELLDYWATWLLAGLTMIVLLQFWRRQDEEEGE